MCTHALRDTPIPVLHDSNGILAAELVHQDVPEDVKFCAIVSMRYVILKAANNLPFSSVLGAAYMIAQTPSLTPGSGSRVLII